MKNMYLIVFALVFFSFQNCSEPIQDIGSNNSASATCPNSPGIGFINEPIVNGTNYRFEVSYSQVPDYVRWSILPLVSGQNTAQMYLETTITAQGDYVVQAMGMIEGCTTPLFTATKNISISGSCATNLNLPTPNPVTVNTTTTIAVANAYDFVSSSFRWQLNGVDKPEWDGFSSVPYSSSTAGSFIFSVSATANCGANKNASTTLVVNQSVTGSATLTAFDVRPYTSDVASAIRGSGVNSVYRVNRAAGKKISLQFANLQSIQTDLSATSGTGCTYSNCYGADIVTASGTCQSVEKTITATGTNGQTSSNTFFFYCPTNQSYCHVGLVANRVSGETCSGCSVNLYIPTGGSSCVAVGNGYYSPANNTSRFACTNAPTNATYTGSGVAGTNNCPWECNTGYVAQGNSCVPQNVTCPATTLRNCRFQASVPGEVSGTCVGSPYNNYCGCYATCNSNGTWTWVDGYEGCVLNTNMCN